MMATPNKEAIMTDKVIHPRSSRRIRSAVMLSVMLLGVAACGSDSNESSDTAAPAASAAAAPAATAAATPGDVQVTETEFKIDMPTSLTAGAHTFDIANSGEFKHDLNIEGEGIEEVRSGEIQPGETAQVSADLPAGTYAVYCSIPTHRGKGMELEITVA
jgi:plastocyanin